MTKKALLVRLDKIGDLVLTIPADQQKSLSEYECIWIVAKGMGFIPAHAHPPRKYFELTKDFTKSNWNQLQDILKQVQPQLSVSFQAPWWINFAFFYFGIKRRVGVLSKWHSYLFLNNGVRQKRSHAEFNELEYNHQLVHDGLGDPSPIEYSSLHLKAVLSTAVPSLPDRFVVIHPGMAGSARNWPLERYIELIEHLRKDIAVVITGTKADAPYVVPIHDAVGSSANVIWLNEKLNIEQLLVVLTRAQYVVAPSTGVLHLAASLGTSVTGIYSPVRVQKATRWGPQGRNAKTLTPKVDCPGHFSCLGEKCPLFDCMTLVSSQEVYQNIQQG